MVLKFFQFIYPVAHDEKPLDNVTITGEPRDTHESESGVNADLQRHATRHDNVLTILSKFVQVRTTAR